MVYQTTDPPREDDEATTEGPAITTRDIVSIRQTQEELGDARCPICRAILVARQGRAGPYFYCQCIAKPSRLAS